MADSVNDKLKRLQDAKAKADEIAQKRQRLAGERDGHEKRLGELEKKCQADYGCTVAELPTLIKQLETEAENSIAEAETILNPPSAPPVPDPSVESVAPAKLFGVTPTPVRGGQPVVAPKRPQGMVPRRPVTTDDDPI